MTQTRKVKMLWDLLGIVVAAAGLYWLWTLLK
jgi:hypothetical protein